MPRPARPINPTPGQLYFDAKGRETYVWTGSAWTAMNGISRTVDEVIGISALKALTADNKEVERLMAES